MVYTLQAESEKEGFAEENPLQDTLLPSRSSAKLNYFTHWQLNRSILR